MLRMSFGVMVLIAFLQNGAIAAEECMRVNSDKDRLECYDAAAGRTPKSEQPSMITNGSWKIREETSKFTHQKIVTMTTSTDDAIDCGQSKSAPITLTLRCQEHETAIYFASQCHMTSSDENNYGEVDIRLDDEEWFVMDMDASTDEKSLGLWIGYWSVPLIKRMFGKERLTALMTPYKELPVSVQVNVAGLEQQIAPLRQACNW